MIRERGYRAMRRLQPAVFSAVVGLACVAFAQSAPSSTGIHLGEGRLHPFIEVDGRYDSLVGFFDRNSAGDLLPSGDIIFHVRPGLKFDLQNPSTYVAFNGSGEYLIFTGLLSPATRSITPLQSFRAAVSLDTRFNQDGAVEVTLGDTMTRSDRTQNAAVGVGVVSLFNDVRLGVPIHPGGRALEITPHVSWQVEFFDPLLNGNVTGCTANDITCNPALVPKMNYSNINFGVNARWKFLPKTALMVDVATDVRTYFDPTPTLNPPGTLFRAQAGLVGLVSPRISVTLLAGYGGDFAGKRLNTVIGNAELGYTPTEMIKVALGYLRTAIPVPAFGSLIDDRGYLRGTIGLWAGRLTFTAQVSADYLSYFGTMARNDFTLGGNVGATFAVTSWFDTGLGYNIGFRDSSANVASVNYVRHEVTLRLGFHY
jgi:hypothetical protein